MIEKIRFLSDQRESQYVSDAEIISLINDGFEEIYYEMVEQNESFFLKREVLNSGEDSKFDIPIDQYKIKSLFLIEGNREYILTPIKLSQKERYEGRYLYLWNQEDGLKYILYQNYIDVVPKERYVNRDFALYYIPVPLEIKDLRLPENAPPEPEFDEEGNEIPMEPVPFPHLPKGYEKYLIYYVVCEILSSEKLRNRDFKEQKLMWRNRILDWSSSRNLDFPKQITDVDYQSGSYYYNVF